VKWEGRSAKYECRRANVEVRRSKGEVRMSRYEVRMSKYEVRSANVEVRMSRCDGEKFRICSSPCWSKRFKVRIDPACPKLHHRHSSLPEAYLNIVTLPFDIRISRPADFVLRHSPFDTRPSYLDIRTSPFDFRPSTFALRHSHFDFRTSHFVLLTRACEILPARDDGPSCQPVCRKAL
jgi:hypothetical protein